MAKRNPQPGPKRNGASKAVSPSAQPSAIQRLPLDELHLDGNNPRFGGHPVKGENEMRILDEIVRKYGVEDVISSIATNGYLETEPLVGVRTDKGVRILEGNRRLAALLILSGDPRAANQERLRSNYQNGIRQPVTAVPVVVYDAETQPAQLLPYLGVKHIVGAKEWDSYAKADWVAKVLEDPHVHLDLNTIEEMIGDSRGAMRRILEGYYIVEQLQNEGFFKPTDSIRKGRGSNLEYPFSWVYNALGYKAVRDWIGLSDEREPKKEPLARSALPKAGQLMTFLFGNSSRKVPAAISDSREISELANCLTDTTKVGYLREGLSVKEVQRKTQPAPDQLRDALGDAHESLTDAWRVIGESEMNEDTARTVEPLAGKVKKLTSQIHDAILDKMRGE